MAQQEQVEQLRAICRECADVPVDNLIHDQKWGLISFEELRSQLETAFSLCKDLQRLPVTILPEDIVDEAISCAQALKDAVEEIREFNITEGNPSERKESISSNVSTAYNEFFKQVQHWIAYLAYSHGDWRASMDEISDNVKQSNDALNEAKEEIEKKQRMIDELVAAVREAAAKTGVAHFTDGFQKEAEKLQTSAYGWLIFTGILACITLWVARYFFLESGPTVGETFNWASVINQITTKLIILGTLITATIWCGKTYRALKHQVTINKHRANALKTFQTFAKAASDATVRDAVLLETTRSIFDPRPSGYLDQETSGGKNEQTRIIEFPKRPLNADE